MKRRADNERPGRGSTGGRMFRLGCGLVVLMVICVLAAAQGEDFVFPGPTASGKLEAGDENVGPRSGDAGSDSQLSRNLRLAQQINSMDSVQEFLSLVQGIPQVQKTFFFGSRIGGAEERTNAEQATPAKCMPELQPVPLKHNTDPSIIYYPSCTRINRCGGCCSHALLSCQPVATEFKNFEVIAAKLGPDGNLNFGGKVIVPLEEHTKCKCDCKTKEEHCTDKQIYIPAECRCVCKNIDEEQKCTSNNMKFWDHDACSCKCRAVEECNTGYYFDQNTCRCREVSLARNWFGSTKRTSYKTGQTLRPENVPPVIIPLDASDPRRKPKEDPEYK